MLIENKRIENSIQANTKQNKVKKERKKAGVVMLKTGKPYVTIKNITRDKESYYVLKGLNH